MLPSDFPARLAAVEAHYAEVSATWASLIERLEWLAENHAELLSIGHRPESMRLATCGRAR